MNFRKPIKSYTGGPTGIRQRPGYAMQRAFKQAKANPSASAYEHANDNAAFKRADFSPRGRNLTPGIPRKKLYGDIAGYKPRPAQRYQNARQRAETLAKRLEVSPEGTARFSQLAHRLEKARTRQGERLNVLNKVRKVRTPLRPNRALRKFTNAD